MKSRLHKLTANEIAQLQKDTRIKALYATAKVRPLNVLEKIILNQLLAEARQGTL